VDNFYQFYLSYNDDGQLVHIKLGMHTPQTLMTIKRLINEGTLKCDSYGESVESYPQKYIAGDKEANWNITSPRFAKLGFGIYLDSQ
jgi:hypothetical protein